MAGKRGIGGMAQKKLLVLVDLDETLAAFEEHFLKKYRQAFPNEPYIPLEDRNTFYIADQYQTLPLSDDILQVSGKNTFSIFFFFDFYQILTNLQGQSWSLSYGSLIYNYLCNQCLSPLTL